MLFYPLTSHLHIFIGNLSLLYFNTSFSAEITGQALPYTTSSVPADSAPHVSRPYY